MKKLWLVTLIFPLLFMWKVVALGQIAFPGDLLVGAYYPWFENFPVKNPLISDVFSQIFSWKKLAAESYLQGQMPLWNQYSFSGYPLLANFHSGALSPLNLLLLGDFLNGWSLLLYLQLALGGLGMYFFLRNLKFLPSISLIGAASFTFSGFALVMWQVGASGYTMTWLVFALLAIDRKKFWHWPILFFLAITGGHFQAAVYFLGVSTLYYLFRQRSIKQIVHWVFLVGVGLLLSAPQILPTLEMAKYSVRFEEGYIKAQNYGLLPLPHLATLFAPDFFGNPTTYNYWGSSNYQETVYYIGIVAAVALIAAGWNFKKLSSVEKFFFIIALGGLLMGFDTPIGRLIYWLRVPALSTSSASRVFMVLGFSSSVLLAGFISRLKDVRMAQIIKILMTLMICVGIGFISSWQSHSTQVLRNLVLPTVFLVAFLIAWLFKNKKIAIVIAIAITLFDLFRFGWKYNPFVSKQLVFPATPETDFLQNQPGYFRIERESGPVMPPNTWEWYNLSSPSGYDPVGLKGYAQSFHANLNATINPSATRYTELSRYLPEPLGEYGVKYLIVRNTSLQEFDIKRWSTALITDALTILENPNFKGLAYFNNQTPEDKIEVQEFTSQRIQIKTTSSQPKELVVATNYYPGWWGTVNDQPAEIYKTNHNFQLLNLSAGDNFINLSFAPISFSLGAILCFVGVLITLVKIKSTVEKK